MFAAKVHLSSVNYLAMPFPVACPVSSCLIISSEVSFHLELDASHLITEPVKDRYIRRGPSTTSLLL